MAESNRFYDAIKDVFDPKPPEIDVAKLGLNPGTGESGIPSFADIGGTLSQLRPPETPTMPGQNIAPVQLVQPSPLSSQTVGPTAPSRYGTGIPSIQPQQASVMPQQDISTPTQQTLPPLTPNAMPPNDWQSFSTPSGGTATMPSVLPDGRSAQDVFGLDERGYTQEEAKRVERESFMAEKKQNISRRIGERAIVKGLNDQGMKDNEIKSAIGLDENPNMTRSEVVKKLKELQVQKQLQGADSRTARETEKIMGMDDEDSKTFMDMETAISGTGADPLGPTISSQMNESQLKEFKRLRTKVAAGRARKDDFVHMNNIIKRATAKSQIAVNKREAEQTKVAIATAQSEAKTKEDKAWLEPRTKELDMIGKKLKAYDDAKTEKEKKELMTPEQRREFLDRQGQILGQIQTRNQGGQVAQQQLTPQQAIEILQEAGGDNDKARKIATERGFNF